MNHTRPTNEETTQMETSNTVWAHTTLKAARAAKKWFRARSVLCKITRDDGAKIEVFVPSPSVSGEGATQAQLTTSTVEALRKLLPHGTEIFA